MYGIVNDFTPEEEAQIREENRWAEEAINWSESWYFIIILEKLEIINMFSFKAFNIL